MTNIIFNLLIECRKIRNERCIWMYIEFDEESNILDAVKQLYDLKGANAVVKLHMIMMFKFHIYMWLLSCWIRWIHSKIRFINNWVSRLKHGNNYEFVLIWFSLWNSMKLREILTSIHHAFGWWMYITTVKIYMISPQMIIGRMVIYADRGWHLHSPENNISATEVLYWVTGKMLNPDLWLMTLYHITKSLGHFLINSKLDEFKICT